MYCLYWSNEPPNPVSFPALCKWRGGNQHVIHNRSLFQYQASFRQQAVTCSETAFSERHSGSEYSGIILSYLRQAPSCSIPPRITMRELDHLPPKPPFPRHTGHKDFAEYADVASDPIHSAYCCALLCNNTTESWQHILSMEWFALSVREILFFLACTCVNSSLRFHRFICLYAFISYQVVLRPLCAVLP